jgi:hypothetical protein
LYSLLIGDKITVDEHNRIHSYEDEPSIIGIDGDLYWAKNGIPHRTTGPASFWEGNFCIWEVNNIKCRSNKEFQEAANLTDEEMIVIILKYGNVGL